MQSHPSCRLVNIPANLNFMDTWNMLLINEGITVTMLQKCSIVPPPGHVGHNNPIIELLDTCIYNHLCHSHCMTSIIENTYSQSRYCSTDDWDEPAINNFLGFKCELIEEIPVKPHRPTVVSLQITCHWLGLRISSSVGLWYCNNNTVQVLFFHWSVFNTFFGLSRRFYWLFSFEQRSIQWIGNQRIWSSH